MRLMKLTGPCLKQLNRATAMKLTRRMVLLMRSDFMEKIGVSFLENVHSNNIVRNLQIGGQNMLLKTLQDVGTKQNSIGQRSARLALKVQSDFKTY